ncbi:MAG TPA: glycoside hydrolase family 3 N-terminal domain-containing protein [Arachnia sp.]|nr:glycoside hydrolase family 3 N-terminal domain-containing protein [Arachnia sp.]
MGNRTVAVVASAALLAAGCAPAPHLPPGQTPAGPASVAVAGTTVGSPSPTVEPQPSVTSCRSLAEGLDDRTRVGQLFMVGVSTAGLDETTRSAIALGRVGSVVLLGNTTSGIGAVRDLTAELGSLGTAELPLLIAVDQEGGQVQRLRGEGFDRIPPATEQGEMAAGELREASLRWGEQLGGAGVHYNLAPVADVVPVAKQGTNAPIGQLSRNYGNDVDAVSRSVVEFVEGMTQAGIATSLKHFPGLGEVDANTDFDAAVDHDTTVDSPSLASFRAGIDAGAGSVMVSSAVFSQIDPDVEGVFSRAVITDLLRADLGFDGVVIADDLGAARAVAGVAPKDRGVRFLAAGGDLVINADPRLMAAMIDATAAEADADATFAGQVLDSAERVLRLKASVGLVDCG